MLKKSFGSWFRREKSKTFHAWQIELTTFCPLRCRMCVREGEGTWQDRRMCLADFRKILPYLADVETVVLEGWGESLLHPDLAEIIGLVKEAGPRVGFVTSGFGLTRERAREVIRKGVDFMGFSLAGATPATHDAIRRNSRLPDLLDAIRLVNEERGIHGTLRPDLHIVYLLLRDNIHELPLLPALAREVGVGEIVLINSCHIATPWQEAQRVFNSKGGDEGYGALIAQAEEWAGKWGIRLRKPALCASDPALCMENPLGNLYISTEGEVAPCVYSHPPLSSPFRRLFCGQEVLVEKVSFGNIFREPFAKIWEGAGYMAFRECFRQREREYRDLYLSLLEGRHRDPQHGFFLSAPPLTCQSCHKIIGV
jgi:MoaA/NifB/PqqE/SkfB family radical SAM enzyme